MTLEDVLLALEPEAVPEDINWNAPDPGAFPPAIRPTQNVAFRFLLPMDFPQAVNNHPDGFTVETIQGRKVLQVNFGAEISYGEGKTKVVAFQRASTFKTDRMENSSIGELIRSLSLRDAFEQARQEQGDTNRAIAAVLSAASGRAVGLADFGWTLAFKDSKVVYRTGASKTVKPKKEGGYTTEPWPRTKEGAFADTVAGPDGQERYGNLEIVRFRLAKPSVSGAAHA